MICKAKKALPDKGDMDTHVSVDGRAVETDINSVGDGRPGRILGSTIETHLAIRVG
jgi:hypothetical protein